ncbi:hypothetical protein D1AOALGA4SA_7955 [Olavius algarvensis Delta 1 endosymbiont]|nr:hypothetical protein D1AOALGA4SA_7955 [Olavius algarvensis Delta 1 endosymbiont]
MACRIPVFNPLFHFSNIPSFHVAAKGWFLQQLYEFSQW